MDDEKGSGNGAASKGPVGDRHLTPFLADPSGRRAESAGGHDDAGLDGFLMPIVSVAQRRRTTLAKTHVRNGMRKSGSSRGPTSSGPSSSRIAGVKRMLASANVPQKISQPRSTRGTSVTRNCGGASAASVTRSPCVGESTGATRIGARRYGARLLQVLSASACLWAVAVNAAHEYILPAISRRTFTKYIFHVVPSRLADVFS